MTFSHYIQHKERCAQWAEIYALTGSYKVIDLTILDSNSNELESEGSNNSSSIKSPPNKKLCGNGEIPKNSSFKSSDSSSAASSQPSSKTSSQWSNNDFADYEANQNYKLRHHAIWSLRQKLLKFKNEVYSEFGDVLTRPEIHKEVYCYFLNPSALLELGYINIANVVTFARKRPYSERRLLKISCLSDSPSWSELLTFTKLLNTNIENILQWSDQRIQNDPHSFRADKNQKRLPVDFQMELMSYIFENSQFNPRRDAIMTKNIEKVNNLATRIFLRYFISYIYRNILCIFLRNHCNTIIRNGKKVFEHPSMVLKCREINELYKSVINRFPNRKISLRSFKELVPFFVKENLSKWANQCYCEKCGNSTAAVRYINAIGNSSSDQDEILKNFKEENWYQKFSCVKTENPVDQLKCLRRKKSTKKCFFHKKSDIKCEGKFEKRNF